jgi:hypothetical protein
MEARHPAMDAQGFDVPPRRHPCSGDAPEGLETCGFGDYPAKQLCAHELVDIIERFAAAEAALKTQLQVLPRKYGFLTARHRLLSADRVVSV